MYLQIENSRGGGEISSETFSTKGQGGSIDVHANSLVLTDGSRIETATHEESPGRGGNIKIEAGSILVDNSVIAANTEGVADTADAGKVEISARDLTFVNDGGVLTETSGLGEGGDVVITADTLVIDATPVDHEPLYFTGISSQSQPGSSGRSGNITVTARDIRLKNGGKVSSETGGTGSGGRIVMEAKRDLVLADNAAVNARSTGSGEAGNIDLSAGDRILLSTASEVTTEAERASGGNITVSAPFMIDLVDSRVTSSVFGPPGTQGGNITIDPQFLILDGSEILAQAFEGRGGNIQIDADFIIQSAYSRIDASSDRGIDGTVVLSTPETDLQKGLVELPVVFVDAASQIRGSCEARRTTGENNFAQVGRGGLPLNSTGLLPAFYSIDNQDSDASDADGAEALANLSATHGLANLLSTQVMLNCGGHR
jgi:large exoprotein involved in heme utilization and adhesion